MNFNLVSAILLCLTTWMTLVHATHGPVATCCPGWSDTRAPLKKIVNYTTQSEGICPVAAVIFYTAAGRRICSNPTSEWATKAILKVDEDKKKALQKAGQNEDISRIDITPAAAIASKNPQQKTSRKGRRRQRKKYRELRNWQRRRN
uniref:C-C motif chemokine 8-like n=1 Tax=Scatophagus argus TaxID=75038 RepID=UPI001ED7EA9F|nr:C-C motif chemokine 8-like [Scatophagus argus]